MCMSHTCVDFIRVPSGKLIVRGFTAMHLLATSAPSIMKMEVAPVSAIARFGAIVIVLILCGDGWNQHGAHAAITCLVEYAATGVDTMRELFDVTIIASSSAHADLLVMARVGFGNGLYAETKLLRLCANLIVSAPNSQVACLAGSTLLCIPLVHGSYPAAMNC